MKYFRRLKLHVLLQSDMILLSAGMSSGKFYHTCRFYFFFQDYVDIQSINNVEQK